MAQPDGAPPHHTSPAVAIGVSCNREQIAERCQSESAPALGRLMHLSLPTGMT
jgi:hypothetical protein